MSFFEIIVIFFVAILVLKPEDAGALVRQIRKLGNFISETKKEVYEHLDVSDVERAKNLLVSEQEKINEYMKKIASLGHIYEGEYDLKKIQLYYQNVSGSKKSKDSKIIN
jgi:Sec-independent protein translocase protein TatA